MYILPKFRREGSADVIGKGCQSTVDQIRVSKLYNFLIALQSRRLFGIFLIVILLFNKHLQDIYYIQM